MRWWPERLGLLQCGREIRLFEGIRDFLLVLAVTWVVIPVAHRFIWKHIGRRWMGLHHLFAFGSWRFVQNDSDRPTKVVSHAQEATEKRSDAAGGDEVLIRYEEIDVMLCHASMVVPATQGGENKFLAGCSISPKPVPSTRQASSRDRGASSPFLRMRACRLTKPDQAEKTRHQSQNGPAFHPCPSQLPPRQKNWKQHQRRPLKNCE